VDEQERSIAASDDARPYAGRPEGIKASTTVGGQREDAGARLRARDDDLGRIAASHLRHHLQIPHRVPDPPSELRQIVFGVGGLQVQRGSRPSWHKSRGRDAITRERLRGRHDQQHAQRNRQRARELRRGGKGGFRLTGGLVYNATEVTGSSLPPASGVYDIGGVPVPVGLVGTLDGKVEFDPIVPYAGLGWGRAPGSGSGFGVTLDLGVIFQGEGEVTLTPIIPAGSPLNEPLAREALQILIEREERDLQDDIVDYDMYPVVSLGISYRF